MPIFYYDLSSPYAYLASQRVDDVLPEPPEWRPISFGVIVRRLEKVPWSFGEDRSKDFEAISSRAAARGLPPVVYPEGWPVETYSLIPLRAATLARDQAERRIVTRELYRKIFVEGRHLADLDTVLDATEAAGMDREYVRAGVESPEVKEQVHAATDEALERGVRGVPTVAVGDQLFWGDDKLEDAAAAA